MHTQAAACSTADETFTALSLKYCPSFQLLSFAPSLHMSCSHHVFSPYTPPLLHLMRLKKNPKNQTTHSFLQRDFGKNKKIKISSLLLVSIWQICSVHVLSLFPTPALLLCFSFVLKHARNNPPVFPDPRFCTSTHTVLSHVSALHLLSSSCFHSQKNKQTTTTEQPASLGNIQQLETAWTKNVSVIEDGLLMPICQMEPITAFYFTFIVIKQLLETWKRSTLTYTLLSSANLHECLKTEV